MAKARPELLVGEFTEIESGKRAVHPELEAALKPTHPVSVPDFRPIQSEEISDAPRRCTSQRFEDDSSDLLTPRLV